MTSQEIASLVVRLTGDSSSFVTSLKQAQVSAFQVASSIKSRFADLKAASDKAAMASARYAAEVAVLKAAYQQGVISMAQYTEGMNSAKKELGNVSQGAHGAGMSLLNMRHSMHALAMTGLIPHQATRGIMTAMYMYRLFTSTVWGGVKALYAFGGATALIGGAVAVAAIVATTKVVEYLTARHTEAAKTASHAFEQMASGAKTAGEAMASINVEVMNKTLKDTVRWLSDPAWSETGGIMDRMGLSLNAMVRSTGLTNIMRQTQAAAELEVTRALDKQIKARQILRDLEGSPGVRKMTLLKAMDDINDELEKENHRLDDNIAKLDMGALAGQRYSKAVKISRESLGQISVEQAMEAQGPIKAKQYTEELKKIQNKLNEQVLDLNQIGMGKVALGVEKMTKDLALKIRNQGETLKDAMRRARAMLEADPTRPIGRVAKDEYDKAQEQAKADADKAQREAPAKGKTGMTAERYKKEVQLAFDLYPKLPIEQALARVRGQFQLIHDSADRWSLAGLIDEENVKLAQQERELALIGLGQSDVIAKKMIYDHMTKTGNYDEAKATAEIRAQLDVRRELFERESMDKTKSESAKLKRELPTGSETGLVAERLKKEIQLAFDLNKPLAEVQAAYKDINDTVNQSKITHILDEENIKLRDQRRELALVGKGADEVAAKKMVFAFMTKTGIKDEAQATAMLNGLLVDQKKLLVEGAQAKMVEENRKLAMEGVKSWMTNTDELKRFTTLLDYARDRGGIPLSQAFKEIGKDLAQMQGYQDQIAGTKLWQETRTELEKYAEEIQRLNGLYERGAVSELVYGRAVEKAAKALAGQSAAQDVKGSLAGSSEAAAKMAKYQEGLRLSLAPAGSPTPTAATGQQVNNTIKDMFPRAVQLLREIKEGLNGPNVGLIPVEFD